MSADNWARCPRCLKNARQEHDAKVAAVQTLYGQIPVVEFDAARAAIPDFDSHAYQTFREDYEIYGADSGVVMVSYSGHCEKCGLGLDFTDERKLDV